MDLLYTCLHISSAYILQRTAASNYLVNLKCCGFFSVACRFKPPTVTCKRSSFACRPRSLSTLNHTNSVLLMRYSPEHQFKRNRFSVLVCRKWKLVNLQANVCCINYRSTFYFWSFEWWPTHQTLIKEVLENENLSPAADFLPQMFSEKQFSCRRERWLTCCFCIVRMEAEQGGTTTGIVIRSFLWTCWLFCCVFEPLFPAGVSLGWREQTGRVAEVLAVLLRAARLKNPALMKPSNVSCIQVWCMRMESPLCVHPACPLCSA